MALDRSTIDELTDTVHQAYTEKEPIPPLSEDVDLTTEEAYTVQRQVFDRIAADPDRNLGHKLGLVSAAKQEQLGIDEPIFAPVVRETLLEEPVVRTDELIAPRIEAEIGYVLDEDVPAPATATDVLTATRAVVPVVEILESRYQDWGIPSAQDVIADLTSAGKVIVGESFRDVSDVDSAMESVVVSVNGEVDKAGVGAEIMGHPARAVSWLADRLDDFDEGLEAGDLIMSGGITAAIDMEPGDVYNVRFANIGSIEVRAE